MSMNSGYSGWSMSKRATMAYADGEMPRSRWTKKAMVEAINDYCADNYRVLNIDLAKVRKDEMFERFFYPSSWHHTSKMCNATDFFSVDCYSVDEVSREMTEEEHEAAIRLAMAKIDAERTEKQQKQAEIRLADEAYRADHRGLSELDMERAGKVLAAYPELFGEFRTSKSGKTQVADSIIGNGVQVVVDGFGCARFSKLVRRFDVEKAIESL